MNDAVNVGSRRMHRAVNHVTGFVDAVIERTEIWLAENRTVVFHLDQDRRSNLLVQHAVGIDEKSIVLSRYSGRNMVGHHVGHAVQRDKTVASREMDARLPFRVGTAVPHGAQTKADGVGHSAYLPYSAITFEAARKLSTAAGTPQ